MIINSSLVVEKSVILTVVVFVCFKSFYGQLPSHLQKEFPRARGNPNL